MDLEPSQTAPVSLANHRTLRVRGARENTLQNLDVDFPLDALVVVTGVSGSGKSSLLYDTIHREGRRRFLETLGRGGRSAPVLPAPPDVDLIDGLPPVLALAQDRGSLRAAQTLADVADLTASLRLLFARAGIAHCPQCGRRVERRTAEEIVATILRLEERKKALILAPIVRGQRGAHRDRLKQLASAGFVRVRIDGVMHEADHLPELAPGTRHDVEIVIDRIIVKPGMEDRLLESVRLALREGNETCLISEETATGWSDRLYSARYACPDCDLGFPPLEVRSFNPASPAGQCLACRGAGTSEAGTACTVCNGERLAAFSRRVTFAGITYPALVSRTVDAAREFFDALDESSANESGSQTIRRVLDLIFPELRRRLVALADLGLGYLTLDRAAGSLSGGELQRARLASVLAGGLTDVCYLLDEPTSGLHALDSERLLTILRRLRDEGNSVLVIEHDPAIFRGADWLIELGPGAGPAGGRLIATGTPDDFRRRGLTPTERVLAVATTFAQSDCEPDRGAIVIRGATSRNLCAIDVTIPRQSLTGIAGVSGSGKSTLVEEVLLPTLRRRFEGDRDAVVHCRELTGVDSLIAVRVVDQSPLGRGGRSTPATVTGLWDELRRVFAGTRWAKLRGFKASRFSFLSPEGRCEACRGRGEQVHRLPYLPEVRTLCPACRGRRFNPQTLAVEYRGHSVADVLDMTIGAARTEFAAFPLIAAKLDTLAEIGLGYLQLGQPAPSLSGGEAQRIRLAAELGKLNPGPTLFLLDEPTAGLHPHDVGRLIALLRRIVDAGHTVVTIEHQLAVLAACNWLIDLGPGAGEAGGRVVAEGSPARVARNDASATGQALRAAAF